CVSPPRAPRRRPIRQQRLREAAPSCPRLRESRYAPSAPRQSDRAASLGHVRTPLGALLAAATAALALSACSGDRSPLITVPTPNLIPASSTSHVIVLVMENKEYGDVIGSRKAPYLNSLAKRYAL